MSWVATAVVGGAVIGAGGAAYAGHEAGKAQEKAASTQAASAGEASDIQQQMFQQQQAYLAPYRQVGYTAAPLLEYLTTGIMPELTPQEQEALSIGTVGQQIGAAGGQIQRAGTIRRPSIGMSPLSTVRPVTEAMQNAMAGGGTPGLSDIQREQLLGKQRAIQAAQGGIQGLIEQNPMYQYQRDIGEKNLNRILAARGRGNSTFGINALSEQNRALTAQGAQDVYNRIANLSNVGQGIGAQLGQNAMAAGTNLGNLALTSGQAIAQGQLGAGQQRASLYSNLSALPMQAYGQYQLYNALAG